jgi:hypothetical protein
MEALPMPPPVFQTRQRMSALHGDSNDPRKTLGKRKTGDTTARQTAHFPPDLQRVIDAWHYLPEAGKSAVLELTERK